MTFKWWKILFTQRKIPRTVSDLTSGSFKGGTNDEILSMDGEPKQTDEESNMGDRNKNHNDIKGGNITLAVSPPNSNPRNSHSPQHSRNRSPRRQRAGSFLPEREEERQEKERRGSYCPSPRRARPVSSVEENNTQGGGGGEESWRLSYKPEESGRSSPSGSSPKPKRPF